MHGRTQGWVFVNRKGFVLPIQGINELLVRSRRVRGRTNPLLPILLVTLPAEVQYIVPTKSARRKLSMYSHAQLQRL